MATQVKFRRDTRANLLLSTPVEGEMGVDTTNDRLILGDGTTAGGLPQASGKDVQNNSFTAGTVTGTDTLVLTLDDAPTAYAQYQAFTITPANNNTGAVTININTLGAKNVKKEVSGALEDLEADDLKADIPILIRYDGVQFIASIAAAGGGGWEIVDSQTISTPTSIVSFTDIFEAGYDYQIYLRDVVSDNNGSYLSIRVSDDSNSTFIDLACFSEYMTMTVSPGRTSVGDNSGGQAIIGQSQQDDDAGLGITGVMTLIEPNTTAYRCNGNFTGDTGSNRALYSVFREFSTQSAVDSFQLAYGSSPSTFSGHNIVLGTISIYRKAVE